MRIIDDERHPRPYTYTTDTCCRPVGHNFGGISRVSDSQTLPAAGEESPKRDGGTQNKTCKHEQVEGPMGGGVTCQDMVI